jgi:pyruvate dehydrogenase E1 component
LLASTVPNICAYDPAFAYEVAAIVKDGLRRMYTEGEDVFYYITLYNENLRMPAKADGIDPGIAQGLYLFREAGKEGAHRATILGSGTGMLAALEAQSLLAEHHDVAATVWSATSYQLLRNEALGVERWNRLHPSEPPRTPYVTEALSGTEGPIVAVTDFMKAVPDQVARFVPGPFIPLGTDGYGRSDDRAALRRHFETDGAHVVVAVLSGLAQLGDVKAETVADAITRYELDADSVEPRLR